MMLPACRERDELPAGFGRFELAVYPGAGAGAFLTLLTSNFARYAQPLPHSRARTLRAGKEPFGID